MIIRPYEWRMRQGLAHSLRLRSTVLCPTVRPPSCRNRHESPWRERIDPGDASCRSSHKSPWRARKESNKSEAGEGTHRKRGRSQRPAKHEEVKNTTPGCDYGNPDWSRQWQQWEAHQASLQHWHQPWPSWDQQWTNSDWLMNQTAGWARKSGGPPPAHPPKASQPPWRNTKTQPPQPPPHPERSQPQRMFSWCWPAASGRTVLAAVAQQAA